MANRLCGYAHVNFQPFTVNTAVMLFSIQYIYYYSAVKDCTISKEKPDYFASTMYTGQLYNYCTQTMIPGCVQYEYCTIKRSLPRMELLLRRYGICPAFTYLLTYIWDRSRTNTVASDQARSGLFF